MRPTLNQAIRAAARSGASLCLLAAAACSSGSALPGHAAGQAAAAPGAMQSLAARAKILYVSPLTVPAKLLTLRAGANGTVKPSRVMSARIDGFAMSYYVAYDAAKNRIWMTSCLELSSGGPVLAFPAGAKGPDGKPAVDLSGSKTGLSGCQNGVALDAAGNVYVADIANTAQYPGGQVAVFGPAQTGNVAPLARIAGNKTLLRSPEGVAMSAGGNLYVANSCQGFHPCSPGVNVYASGANGNVAPIAAIRGPRTKIRAAFGVAFDRAGNLYVADPGSSAIEVFARGAKGNVAPMRVITGAKTRIRTPSGIAVDAAGYVYLGNFDQSTSDDAWPVLVFAPGANGNVAPAQTIHIKTPRFSQPSGVAVR